MATGTGVNASKTNAYGVLTGPTGASVSKTVAYAVLGNPSMAVSKTNAYAVVQLLSGVLNRELNYNDSSPAAPSNSLNARWQIGPTTGVDGTTGLPIYPVSVNIPAGTTSTLGVLKPDGTSITVDTDGTIHDPVMVASGASHAAGRAPDPGATAGTTKFLREDATWAVPAGGGSSPGQAITAPVAANFSWVNQGTASLDSTNNQLSILAPAAGGAGTESWRVLEATLPGAFPWTLTAAIICQLTYQNNYNGVAIGVKDTGNNKMLVFKGIVSDSGALKRTVTSYSNATTGTANLLAVGMAFPPSYLMWLRIVADTTNFTYQFSPNGGISWLQFYQAARTAYLTSPATAFFAVNADSSNPNAASLVSWTLV